MQMLTVKTVLTRNQSNSHPRFACPPGSGALTTLPTLPLAQCTAGTSKFRVLAVALGMLILLGVSSPLCFSLLSQVQREPARLRERPGARGEGDHHRHVAGVPDDHCLSSSHSASCRPAVVTSIFAPASPMHGSSPTSPRLHHLLTFYLACRTCFSALGAGVHAGISPQERSRGATSARYSPQLVGEADIPSLRGC